LEEMEQTCHEMNSTHHVPMPGGQATESDAGAWVAAGGMSAAGLLLSLSGEDAQGGRSNGRGGSAEASGDDDSGDEGVSGDRSGSKEEEGGGAIHGRALGRVNGRAGGHDAGGGHGWSGSGGVAGEVDLYRLAGGEEEEEGEEEGESDDGYSVSSDGERICSEDDEAGAGVGGPGRWTAAFWRQPTAGAAGRGGGGVSGRGGEAAALGWDGAEEEGEEEEEDGFEDTVVVSYTG
jgi:hypothetical protein